MVFSSFLFPEKKYITVNKVTKMMEIMQKLAVANRPGRRNGPQDRGECWKKCRKKAKFFI